MTRYCGKCNDSYPQGIASKLRGSKCSICTGKFVTNSLASLNPTLASEWHPTLNGELTSHDVTIRSNKKVWWLGKCGHEFYNSVDVRSKGVGCRYCAGQQVLKGFNDMWSTNPKLASLLNNPEDGYDYMQSSDKKVDWKCPNCEGIIKNKRIADINKNRLYCQKCDKGKSYPEMFMYNILLESNIEFEAEKSFSWSNRKRYDFYLPNHNCIIEVHGEQHYSDKFNIVNKSTLRYQITNDKYKEDIAIKNGIQHYVVIEARKSERFYLTNNIVKSLSFIIKDIDYLNFEEIHRKSMNSRYSEICKLWNEGLSKEDISNELKLSLDVIGRYLTRSFKDGITSYKIGTKQPHVRKVVQLSMEMVKINEFNDIKSASAKINRNATNISACCRGKTKSSGGYKWMYKEDYEKYIEEQKQLA